MKQGFDERIAPNTFPWLWTGFFSIIILLALLSSFAVINAGKQLANQEIPEQSLLRIIIDGVTYHIPEEAQAQLVSETRHIIQEQQAGVTQQVQLRIEQLVDEAFSPVHARIPEFADWYYSLGAEYLRYAHAIGGDAAGFLQDQLLERVFQPAQLELALDNLPAGVQVSLEQQLDESRLHIIRRLQSLVSAQAVQEQPESRRISRRLDLDPMLSMEPNLDEQVINRQLVSGLTATGMGVAVGKGLGPVIVKKTLTNITAGKSFQAASSLLAKLAMSATVKGGGSLGAAATGMALCSPAGPGALLCGVAAGIATWIAVDATIINIDELLNREAFEADMQQAVFEQQERLTRIYADAYSVLLARHFSSLQQSGNKLQQPPDTFVPADTLKR